MGYFNDKPNTDPDAILFASHPAGDAAEYTVRTVSLSSLVLSCAVCAALFGAGGFHMASKAASASGEGSSGGGSAGLHAFSSSVASKVAGFSGAHRGYSSIDDADNL